MIKIIAAVLTGLLCNFSEAKREALIPIQCDTNSYRCADNSRCVQAMDLCDYNKDCDDFSDEEFSMCRIFLEKRGSCTAGNWKHPRNGCQAIDTICSSAWSPRNRGYRSYGDDDYDDYEQYLPLCSEIKSGLKPLKELMEKDKEISTLREKLIAYDNETKLEDIFSHLASSYSVSSLSKNYTDCPPLYVNIEGKCMAFFTVAKVTWAEAKLFCESISGTLAILSKMKDYESLLTHLKSQDLTTDFWIGGHYYTNFESNSSSWIWLDEKDIIMGAPYWSLYHTSDCTTRGTSPDCYSYSLAPRENKNGFCLSLDYGFHFYFTDQNCHEKRSPLCFYNEKIARSIPQNFL